MTEALDRILAALSKLGRTEAIARLQDGLTAAEVHKRMGAAGLAAPCQVVELYCWRNGMRVEPGTSLDDVHFFPGFWFLSLEAALVHYAAFRDDRRWRQDWLPVFANGGGDFYAVITSEDRGGVVGFLIDHDEHPVEYPSLEAMIFELATSYDTGSFFVDERGYLEES